MKRICSSFVFTFFSFYLVFAQPAPKTSPVDYVNPTMGNISHLLVPTYPTIHLPNGMLRVYPERADYTTDQVKGLPLIITSHRGRSAFNLSPVQTTDESDLKAVHHFTYDNEEIHPYRYQVILDEENTKVEFAPSNQSAIYSIDFTKDKPAFLIFNTIDGKIIVDGNKVYASQKLANNTVVYLFAETETKPEKVGLLKMDEGINPDILEKEGKDVAVAFRFVKGTRNVKLRYGISFISTEQAERNLRREVADFNLDALASRGRSVWNDALGKIEVEGVNEDDKVVFYTSLYRCFERPVSITEDGKYFSAFD